VYGAVVGDCCGWPLRRGWLDAVPHDAAKERSGLVRESWRLAGLAPEEVCNFSSELSSSGFLFVFVVLTVLLFVGFFNTVR
jgi:hypothetical protein